MKESVWLLDWMGEVEEREGRLRRATRRLRLRCWWLMLRFEVASSSSVSKRGRASEEEVIAYVRACMLACVCGCARAEAGAASVGVNEEEEEGVVVVRGGADAARREPQPQQVVVMLDASYAKSKAGYLEAFSSSSRASLLPLAPWSSCRPPLTPPPTSRNA